MSYNRTRAIGAVRTRGLLHTGKVLYHLSYDGTVFRVRLERTLCTVWVCCLLPIGLPEHELGCRIRTRLSETRARRPASWPDPNESGSGDSNPVRQLGRLKLYQVSYYRMSRPYEARTRNLLAENQVSCQLAPTAHECSRVGSNRRPSGLQPDYP